MDKSNQPARKIVRRLLSVVLSIAMIASLVVVSDIGVKALLTVEPAESPGDVYFYAPETIYVDPVNNTTQWFVNNYAAGAVGGNWGSLLTGEQASGYIHFYCAGASDIEIELDEGPAGYAPDTSTITGSGGNGNVTLAANVTAPNAGLARWKATYKVNGIPYTSYCYSYVYVPNKLAISGSAAHGKNNISGNNGYDGDFDAGMFIVGSHYGPVAPSGGAYSPNTTLQNNLWGATYPAGGNVAMTSLLTATADGGIVYSSHTAGGTQWSFSHGDGNGGRSSIQVDSSRYNNLNQIPQLKTVHAVTRAQPRLEGNASIVVANGRNTNWDGGLWAVVGYVQFTGGTWIENPVNTYTTTGIPAITSGSGQIYSAKINSGTITTSGSTQVYSSYHWHIDDNAGIDTKGNVRLETGTTIDYTLRDKSNLRKQMQEEIKSGLQVDGMRGETYYRSTLETLAEALGNPAYDFGVTASEDLNVASRATSMAGRVVIARSQMEPKTGQAEASYRNAITGGIIPIYVSNNNISYEMGESVTAQYDEALDIPEGYNFPPVAVSVPYLDASDNAVTSAAAPGVTGSDVPAIGLYRTIGADGIAPDSDSAPNKNVSASRLTWIWWLAPITYTLQYLPGDGTGTAAPITVTYGESVTMPDPEAAPIGFTKPDGATFAGWKFSNGKLAGGTYGTGASGLKNMTVIQGDIITAVAMWTGGASSTFTFDFGTGAGIANVNPGGGTLAGPTQVGFEAPAGTLVGALMSNLPTATRAGYAFDGWYLDQALYVPLGNAYSADVASTGRKAYAKWVPYKYNISYSMNTGTGAAPPQHSNVAWDSNVTLLPATDLTKLGYTFEGWSMTQHPVGPNPPAADYQPGDSVSNLLTPAPTYDGQSVMLYAVWEAKTPLVSFHANWHDITPADGTPPGIIASQTKYFGGTYGVDSSGTAEWLTDPTRFGWTFGGWYTVQTPPGTGMKVESSTPLNQAFQEENHTLYAYWINGTPVDVTLDPGAADATLPSKTTPGDIQVIQRGQGTELLLTDLEAFKPTRPGYTFSGWEIDNPANAAYTPIGGTVYAPGATGILINADVTLTALWTVAEYQVRYHANYPDAPAPGYTAGGALNLSGTDSETPADFTRAGYNLTGYAYDSAATDPDFDKAAPDNLTALLTGTGNTEAYNGTDPIILNVYATWKAKGGTPDNPGEDPPGPPPIDPPVGPPFVPPLPDDDDPETGNDGSIVLYYTLGAADVTLTPNNTRKFLTYDAAYGELPSASKAASATHTYTFEGVWKVVRCGHATYDLSLDTITKDTIVKHECSIWVKPVFTAHEIPPPPPPPTCWERFQACLIKTRNWIIKLFWPALAVGLPIINYRTLTVDQIFELPFHTLFIASVIGCVLIPFVLVIPSLFTVIDDLAPKWWPNVKRIYLIG